MPTPQVPAPLTRESLGIPGERERYLLRKRIIRAKLNGTMLPAMRRHGIDMWIMIGREFNADPLLMDIGGGWPGVRNAYVFFDNGGAVPEKIFIGSHEQREDLFRDVYDIVTYYGYDQAGLAPYLRDVVQARNPQRIGINMSPTLPMADGLTATLKGYLENAIGPDYTARLVSAELVARDFRATRLPEEFGPYRRLCEWTVAWLDEGGRPMLEPDQWARRGDAEALFLNTRGGRLSRQGAWIVVRRVGEQVGLSGRLTPHVLRHSCATHMLDHGADIRTVQELLGHASISTTQVYTLVSTERLLSVYRTATGTTAAMVVVTVGNALAAHAFLKGFNREHSRCIDAPTVGAPGGTDNIQPVFVTRAAKPAQKSHSRKRQESATTCRWVFA